jgi:hypothetical protein
MNRNSVRGFPWIRDGEVGVLLTGGLGNQIFQFVAGFAQAKRTQSPLVVIDHVLKPWPGNDGKAELFSLLNLQDIATRITPEETSQTLGIRAAHLSIASCNSGLNWAQRDLRRSLARAAEMLALARRGSFGPRLWSQYGNGYDSRLGDLSTSHLIIGYFQTYKYVNQSQLLQQLRSNLRPVLSERLPSVGNPPTERPYISLHVRRGDYKDNPQFGHLSLGYYEKCLAALSASQHEVDDVLVFSDDINAASRLLTGSRINHRLYFTDNKNLSATETLRLMSRGSAIITANSSLSYWAAMLSKCLPSQILCPDPWFRIHPTPTGLVPPAWVPIKSSFEEIDSRLNRVRSRLLHG